MNSLAQVRINTPPILTNLKFLDSANGLSTPTVLPLLVSRLLVFSFVIAGLIFFFQLIVAGFGMMTSAGDSAKLQAATKAVTNAAIGLFVVLTSYFLTQLIEVLFSIRII